MTIGTKINVISSASALMEIFRPLPLEEAQNVPDSKQKVTFRSEARGKLNNGGGVIVITMEDTRENRVGLNLFLGDHKASGEAISEENLITANANFIAKKTQGSELKAFFFATPEMMDLMEDAGMASKADLQRQLNALPVGDMGRS